MPTATSTACSAGSTTTGSAESTSRSAGTGWCATSAGTTSASTRTKVVNFLEGAAISIGKLLFSVIVVLVVSIYMLLDFPKLERRIDRRFPPEPGSEPLVLRMEHSLVSYVKGQSLVSLIIGTSAGVGLMAVRRARLASARPEVRAALRCLGCDHGADSVSRTVARRDSAVPLRARRRTRSRRSGCSCCSSAIHQVEGHIVVPNVMGSALRLHPLLVIFGLLAGRRDLRAAGCARRAAAAWPPAGRCGSSSASGSSWSPGRRTSRSRCRSSSTKRSLRRRLPVAE